MSIIENDFPIEELNRIALKEGNAKKPIYQIHKWWARRLGSIFRAIIITSFLKEDQLSRFGSHQKSLNFEDENSQKKFDELFWGKFGPGGSLINRGIFYKNLNLEEILGYRPIILDPFMGGGTTVVEALRLACKVIGIDLNPVAWFVTKKEIEPVNLDKFDNEFKNLESKIENNIKNYYKTKCPKCKREIDVMYILWIKKVKCVSCKKEVPLFYSFRICSRETKDKTTHAIFCPKCNEIFETDKDYRLRLQCPRCSYDFIPNKGNTSGGKYTCPHCKQKYDILKSVRLSGKTPESDMFAIEYYCDQHGRGYKKIDDFDSNLFNKAKEEFEKEKDKLLGRLMPDQKIPDGYNTKQAKNYFYKYFYQMFNERQLLCLSMLLEEILKIEDEDIKEMMLLTFSDCINANNMFCIYNAGRFELEPFFGDHHYAPPTAPVENNVWGAKYGRGSFTRYFLKTRRAEKYCQKPYEILVTNGKTQKIFLDEKISNGNAILKSQTSEDLSFIKEKVDCIITDPPYYDNVEYSEIADFFYVWLRLALKDKYPKEFKSLYSPTSREIVVNTYRISDKEKAKNFFLEGLTNVWKECHKVLKDDGLLIFTFHHRDPDAWASVLKSLLNAKFFISSVYPVHSEARTGVRIVGKESRSFDTIIVAKKKLESKDKKTWTTVQDQVHLKAKYMLKRAKTQHSELSNGDISTIVLGKCLEVFSEFYPHIYKESKKIEVEDAVKGIMSIIDTLKIKEYLPENIDTITSIYARSLADLRSIKFDELNKILQIRGISQNELKYANLIQPKGNIYKITSPKERGKIIDEMSHKKLSELKYYIDVIHLFYYLYNEGKPLPKTIGDFDTKILKDILIYLYSKTKDKTYKTLKDLLETYKPTKKPVQMKLGLK